MLATTLATLAIGAISPALTLTKYKSFEGIRATAVATAPIGPLMAVASEDLQVRLIDSKSMSTVFQLKGHPMTVYGLAFSKDGKFLLSGDESARIWLWDAKSGKKVREYPRIKGHKRGIQAIAFSPDGKRFASVGKDDLIKVWMTSGGDPVATIEGKGANFYGVAFLPNGSLVTGTLLEGMRIYSPSYVAAATLKCDGGQGANDVAVNGLGTIGVTAGRDGAVTVWELKGRTKLGAMLGHSDWVTDVAMAPNGRVAASSSTDAKVVVWDVKGLTRLATIEGRAVVDSLVAFTSDGKYLLTSDAANALQVYQVSPPQK